MRRKTHFSLYFKESACTCDFLFNEMCVIILSPPPPPSPSPKSALFNLCDPGSCLSMCTCWIILEPPFSPHVMWHTTWQMCHMTVDFSAHILVTSDFEAWCFLFMFKFYLKKTLNWGRHTCDRSGNVMMFISILPYLVYLQKESCQIIESLSQYHTITLSHYHTITLCILLPRKIHLHV